MPPGEIGLSPREFDVVFEEIGLKDPGLAALAALAAVADDLNSAALGADLPADLLEVDFGDIVEAPVLCRGDFPGDVPALGAFSTRAAGEDVTAKGGIQFSAFGIGELDASVTPAC